MRQLPSLLSRKQSLFIKKCANYNITPDQDRFWKIWSEEGMDELVSKRIKSEVSELGKAEAIKQTETIRNSEREAELVLQSLYNIDVLRIRACKKCNNQFGTNYNYERYCSNTCRAAALRERGIDWSIDRDEADRWKGQSPSTIKPETLETLKLWSKQLLGLLEGDIVSAPSIQASEPEPKPTTYMFKWMDPNYRP